MPNDMDDNRIVLPEGEYAEYLATLAANIADARIKERENKWRAILGLIVTIVAVLGVTNISSIKDDLKSKIELDIKTKVPDEVAKYVDQNRSKIVGESLESVNNEVESRIAFMQLFNISLELSKGTGFTRDQRDAAVGLIEKVSKNNKIVDSPEFAGPLEKIVDAFLRADQALYIDKIESSLEERIAKSHGITLSMVQHYGMRVSGSKVVDDREKALFDKYARLAAEAFRTPEASAPYQIAIDYKVNGNKRSQFGAGVLQDVGQLSPEEQTSFLQLFDVLRNGKFYTHITGEIERIENLFKSAYSAYENEIDAIRATADTQPSEDPAGQFLDMLRQMNQ